MPSNIFFAEEGSIVIGSATGYAAEVKDINVTGGARGVNQIRTFGNNAYGDEQPADPIEISFTTITRDADFWTMFLGGSLAAGGSAYEEIPRTRRDVEISLYDLSNTSGAQIMIYAHSAWATQADFTLNATDHGEQSPTFTCLTKDFLVKHTANRVTNAI